MNRMPDFIIIGAMKCATTTLHEQLARQPGIFMTEPKEPYFFSNDEVWTKGLEWYKGLYSDAEQNDLCGESSTHYTKLPTYPETVIRMHAHVPNAKLIYVIRHPIDRLISQYIHEWSEKIINVPIDEAVALRPELTAYSKYAMQIRPFLETYGAGNILLIFFEHLLAESQRELERVVKFIGYQDVPRWVMDDAINPSAARLRRSPLRDAIVWNPVGNWLRRMFIPQSIRDRVKGFWQMKQRPQLSERHLKMLEYVFDEDLAQLSRWIDVELTCQTFKQNAKAVMPNWSNEAHTMKRLRGRLDHND